MIDRAIIDKVCVILNLFQDLLKEALDLMRSRIGVRDDTFFEFANSPHEPPRRTLYNQNRPLASLQWQQSLSVNYYLT